jgi:hypothetical protein
MTANEFYSMRKEAAIAYFKYYLSTFLEGLRKA